MNVGNSSPINAAAVYWVGHSLVESKIKTPTGDQDLMSMVGTFAKARNLEYAKGDHTLWGSSLSALWRGRPHGYDRDATVMIAKREAFERDPSAYDTLVLTEGLPLLPSITREFSPYYVRRFYCALKSRRPEARVFLYQSWLNFQGNDEYSNYPPPDRFDWRTEMRKQRRVWEQIADAATGPTVDTPGWLSRFGLHGRSDGGCQPSGEVHVIPVGDALLAIADRIEANETNTSILKFKNGTPLSMADFFANPYIDWPKEWPREDGAANEDVKSRVASLTKRNPKEPLDDIHPSYLGVYVAALVHFAAIYRQSPVDLPAPKFLDDSVAREIACIAWKTVLEDKRSGVTGPASC